MSVLQAATQAVTSVAQNVASTAKQAVADTASQIAKTPLDILEELLGQAPADGPKEKKDTSDTATAGQYDAANADIKSKLAQDESFRAQQHQQLHDQIAQQSQGYYEQKKQMEAQTKQAQEQQKEQERFQIKQLEKRKSEDYALKAAQDASSAEKRVGAG